MMAGGWWGGLKLVWVGSSFDIVNHPGGGLFERACSWLLAGAENLKDLCRLDMPSWMVCGLAEIIY